MATSPVAAARGRIVAASNAEPDPEIDQESPPVEKAQEISALDVIAKLAGAAQA